MGKFSGAVVPNEVRTPTATGEGTRPSMAGCASKKYVLD